jgi:serine/threonine protein kinase
MNSSPNPSDRERILAELARREGGAAGDSLSPEEESTLVTFRAEFDTLLTDLRQPPPVDAFEDESGCRRAIELAVQVGRRADDSFEPDSKDADDRELERVGPYQLTAKLGQGGMGAVYRGVHDKLKRVVAVKLLRASRMKDPAAIARFEREMEAIGALNHPNIVAAHDAGEAAGMHYLVMECVEGLDLAALARRVGPLPLADACEIIRQAAQGLKAAHGREIVHRDLKPSNLMLAQGTPEHPQATVKILDFGLARLAPLHTGLQELTDSGQIMGTLKYMAPEQCLSSRDVDVRADIYSLGATLYKLLGGSSPYSDERFDSPLTLLAALGNEEPPHISTRAPDVPSPVAAIVHRMLAKNPADRFATPGDVIAALGPWSQGADLQSLLDRARSAEDPASTTARSAPRPPAATSIGGTRGASHRFLLGSVLLAGLALLAVAAAVFFWDGSALNDPSLARSRGAAEWLALHNARFGVLLEDGEYVEIGVADSLPAGPLQLNTVDMASDKLVRDEDLARFQGLPRLQALNLSFTHVGDAGLDRLHDLPRLEHLFLVETRITDAGLAKLGRFPRLATLYLSKTAVTDAGLEHLASIPTLYELMLVECDVSDAGLAELTSLTNLRSLFLQGTKVTARGVAELQLALPACSIQSDFTEKEISDASTVEKTAGVDVFQRNRRLAEWLLEEKAEFGLAVQRVGFVEVRAGGELPSEPFQVATLSFGENESLLDEELSRLDDLLLLGTLILNATTIGNDGLRRLGDLPGLKALYLSDTLVTNAGLAELRRFPRLAVLHLNATRVDDDGMSILSELTNLRELQLLACAITDDGVERLAPLKKLEKLNLQDSAVTAEGVAKLKLALPDCRIESDFAEEEIGAAIEKLQTESASQ